MKSIRGCASISSRSSASSTSMSVLTAPDSTLCRQLLVHAHGGGESLHNALHGRFQLALIEGKHAVAEPVELEVVAVVHVHLGLHAQRILAGQTQRQRRSDRSRLSRREQRQRVQQVGNRGVDLFAEGQVSRAEADPSFQGSGHRPAPCPSALREPRQVRPAAAPASSPQAANGNASF